MPTSNAPLSFDIQKSNGETQTFNPEKLRLSLERTGAGESVIDEVLAEIAAADPRNMTSGKIYNIAFRKLRQRAPHSAGRYRLKRAIFDLGPSGFPFEHFIGELFAHQGYDVEVGVILDGACVSHEVDVLATKGQTTRLMECKFHRDPSRKSTIQVPLYIDSRFRDIRQATPERAGDIEGWIFTNTRFSQDARDYGNCVGLHLVDWDSPADGSLKARIDGSGLHPLTCLTSLNRRDKKTLLEEGIVLCRDLNAEVLGLLHLPPNQVARILMECEGITGR